MKHLLFLPYSFSSGIEKGTFTEGFKGILLFLSLEIDKK